MNRKDTESAGDKRGKGGWLFLVAVVVLYGVSAAIDSDLTQRALDSFTQMAGKIVPVLALVFILIFITNFFSILKE